MKKKNKKVENANKNNVIIDKEIQTIEDDIIGIEAHVDTLKDAINEGAGLISLSSGYGGGKSSICNIISNDKMFNKTSVVSLWDVVIDKDKKIIKTGNTIEIEQNEFSSLNLYKSFLFQLAGDFHGARYSRYINKALNRTTTFFNIYSKGKIFFLCIFSIILSSLTYAISFGIRFNFKLNWLNPDISLNQDFIKYISLFFIGLFSFFAIYNGKILYTSWKTERDRLITTDDVTSLFVGLINDSIRSKNPLYIFKKNKKYKKNLVVIEDVDRCLEDSTIDKKLLLSFIKGLVKLKHYKCKNYILNRKLESVIFIIALDESKIYNIEKNEYNDEILKLFDYRLDLGKIHNEDFTYILNELLSKVNIENTDINVPKFNVILRGENNSIRLIKNIINDALLKYHSLKKKFNSTVNIRLEPCIAYSYLKNKFYEEFTGFLKDEHKMVKSIKGAIDSFHQTNEAVLDSYAKNENFREELKVLIKIGYIDFEFKNYFYNYPKGEPFTTIYESIFRSYMIHKKPLDTESNKLVSEKKVKDIQNYINQLSLNYPLDLLDDIYISRILFEMEEDIQLLNFLYSVLKLDTQENQKISISNLQKLFNLNMYDNIKIYLSKVNSNHWKKENIIETPEFYEFRLKLIKYFRDEIAKFDNLFLGNFDSIKYEEFECLSDKVNANQLINMNKFSEDLEIVIPKLIKFNTIDQNINLAKYWEKNIVDKEKFANYLFDLLKQEAKYNLQLLSMFKKYYTIVSEMEFYDYYNSLIPMLSIEELQKVNQLKYKTEITDENLKLFFKHSLKITPLISLFNNRQFEKIVNLNDDISNYFSDTNFTSEVDDLYIIDFKKFLLDSVNEYSKFDFLFKNNKYPMEIDWSTINNVHLLFTNNYQYSGDIIANIRNCEYDDTKIEMALNEMEKMVLSYPPVVSDILYNFMDEKCDIIKSNITLFKDKIKSIINKMGNSSFKAKTAVYYQAILGQYEPGFDELIKGYSNENDKLEYAKFLNDLEEDLIVNSILAIGLIYPFNEKIIKLLIDNGEYAVALKTSIKAANYNFINDAINNLDALKLIEIYKEDEYKQYLIKNDNFLNKIESSNMSNMISKTDIINELNENTHIKLLGVVINNFSDLDIINILSSLTQISIGKEKQFIDIIKNKKVLIANNPGTCEIIKNLLPTAYKRQFTMKIINQ